VIEGDAIAFANRMQSRYGGRVVLHRRFSTAKWLLDDPDAPLDRAALDTQLRAEGMDDPTGTLPAHLDFVTARTEFYTAPSVLPTVEDSSIKLDLHRRDFSINTLALCLNPDRWGDLLDFYGGLHDLNQGMIRVLHSLSFVDDPTRILRAVRYEQRFGFTIEPRTLELLHDALELVDKVTPARIRHELERILGEEQPERALARLDELGVLSRIHPDLAADDWVVTAMGRIRRARAEAATESPLAAAPMDLLYWSALVFRLPEAIHAELSGRLGLKGETQRLMRSLARLHAQLDELSVADLPPSTVVTLLEQVEPLALTLAPSLIPDRRQARDYIARYLALWRHIVPEIQGQELTELGVPRGPLFGTVLRALRGAKLDGHVRTRADEEAFVAAYLSKRAAPGH
jgi:tRNA nucleotidyltransferase (CCA-adding enzyme)